MAGRTMAEIWVAVRPDTAKTGAELNAKLGKVDTSKAGKKAGDSFTNGFGGSIKKIAGLAAGVVAGVKVKNFLLESTNGYRDHVKIAKVTNQVIKTTGAAAKVSATQVGALSDAIELKTGVDGDAIQSGANLLLTFTNVRNETGKGNQVFTRATGLLADMSVALGQDTKGSAIQLGKALNDPITGVTALSKVGVSFTEQQKKQIKTLVESGNTLKAQKIILNELGKEFGGAAAAAADPADRAKVAYHQLQDQIGSGTLPVVNALAGSFADYLAPALIDIATKYGPQISGFLTGLAPKINASLGLLITGDFNRKIGQALGGLQEDSPYVAGLLTIREDLIGVKDTLSVLATGNFTGRIFGQEEDSKFVAVLLQIHQGLSGVYEAFRLLVTGDFRKQVFGQGEDSKFTGFLLQARDQLSQLGTSIKNLDWSSIKAQAAQAGQDLGQLLPVVAEFRKDLPGITDLINVGANALHFLAQHTDELRKAMPLLVGAFIAYKVAQAAANAAALVEIPLKIGQILANRQLAASNKALVASRVEATAATIGDTIATGANTGAKNVGIITSIRQRAATIASAVAAKAVQAATIAWTGVQWLLNAALTANPIGLVVLAIGLLVAGFIVAWKHSETFRNIVTAAFNAIKSVGVTVISFVWNLISGFFLDLLRGAAKAFGWVPGLGPKLKQAAKWFGDFRDSVNNKLDGLKDHQIDFTIKYSATGVNLTTPSSVGRKADGGPGGPVDGPGTTTSDTAGLYALSRKEWVIKAKSSMKYGDYAMASVNAGTATIIPNGGFAAGGSPGLNLRTTGNPDAIEDAAAAVAAASAQAVAKSLAHNRLGATMAFGRSQAGKPYVWGAAGPNGYDCSGFVSALINYAKGRNPYSRLGATGSMPWSDMAAGRGPFMVGWFNGNPGHTAATINGVNFESSGGVGVHYGNGARGADNSLFTNRMRVTGFAKGGRPGIDGIDGDLPFDLFSARGRRFVGTDILSQIGVKKYDQGGLWPNNTLGVNTSGRTETVEPDGGLKLHKDSVDDLADAIARRPLVMDGRRLDSALSRSALGRGY